MVLSTLVTDIVPESCWKASVFIISIMSNIPETRRISRLHCSALFKIPVKLFICFVNPPEPNANDFRLQLSINDLYEMYILTLYIAQPLF